MIDERIQLLKTDIIKGRLAPEQIFQKHVIDVPTYFFNNYLNDSSEEYDIKEHISNILGVHLHEVIFVGSSKLGYSLNPKKAFATFDSKFKLTNEKRDKSDLDIAIVSPKLFDKITVNSYEFTKSYSEKWFTNDYYTSGAQNTGIPLCYKYYEYLIKGWFRPDMRPPNFDFCVSSSFEELKGYIYKKYKRKLGLGVYKDWYYFKNYHMNNLKNLTFNVKSDVI